MKHFYHTCFGVIVMKKKKSKTRVIRDECNEILNQIPHNLTKSQYKNIVRRYVEYCRREFDVQNFEDCKGYIQTYCDYLQNQGYTTSTIHTYISGVCKCWDVPLKLIEKPIRHISEYTKGRSKYHDKYRTATDLAAERWKDLVQFQMLTGIRRAELSRLTGKDLVFKDGIWNIFVRNGKGGKDSYIYVSDIDKVKPYFEGKGPNEKIFDEALFKNDLNLHWLRAKNAQLVYKLFEDRIKKYPTYRDELEKLVRKRWAEGNKDKKTGKPKPFPEDSINGKYVLRGLNRKFAIKNKLPFVYDKLILKAVSVLCLSHYRTDITILYMLYI